MEIVDPTLAAVAVEAGRQAHAAVCISPVTAHLICAALVALAVALLPAADPRR